MIGSRLAGLPALARLEWRGIRRHPWRSTLIAALVAIPVAGMVVGASVAVITEPTRAEVIQSTLGKASLRLDATLRRAELDTVLPSHAKVEPISFGRETLTTNGTALPVETLRLNPDGLASGMVTMLDGRPPGTPGEVAVTQPLLDALNLAIGDELLLAHGRHARIVGLFEMPERWKRAAILYPFVPETFLGNSEFLVSLPKSHHQATASQLQDHIVKDREAIDGGRSALVPTVYLLGGVVLGESGLIILSAILVGLRRRQREIGLLASCGATRGQILSSVALSVGIVTLAGAGVGIVIGILAAAGLTPFLDHWNGRRNGSFEFVGSVYLAAFLISALIAFVSACGPAFLATRMTINEALASRRPPRTGPGKFAVVGVAVLVIGGTLVASAPMLMQGNDSDADNVALQSILCGSLLSLVGLGACSPLILQTLAQLAAWLWLPWRLAVRDGGRHCGRTGPIVTAMVAGTALSITTATIYRSVTELDHSLRIVYRRDQLMVTGIEAETVARVLAKQFDRVAIAPFQYACSQQHRLIVKSQPGIRRKTNDIVIADREVLRALGVDDLPVEAFETMRQGQLLCLTDDRPSKVDVLRRDTREWLTSMPTLAPPKPASATLTVGYAVAPEVAEDLGWHPERNLLEELSWLVRLGKPIDDRIRAQAAEIAGRYPGTTVQTRLDQVGSHWGVWSMFAVSLVTGMIVVIAAAGLSAVEANRDHAILHFVGASPQVHRHFLAANSAYLALLGCVLAVPAGLIPAYGVTALVSLPFQLPLREILFAVSGLPAIAYFLSWFGLPSLVSLGRAGNRLSV